MKKKTLVIIIISIMVVLSAILIISAIVSRDKGRETLFADTDYPVMYKQVGSGLEIKMNGKKTKELSWTVSLSDEEYVDVVIDGKEKKGMATFNITPKKTGVVNVSFSREAEVAGYKYDAVAIMLPIYVEETEKGLVASILNEATFYETQNLCGETTDYPFFLENNEDGSVDMRFVNGASDWAYDDPMGYTYLASFAGEDSQEIKYIYSIEEDYMYDDGEVVDEGTPSDAEIRASIAPLNDPGYASDSDASVTDASESDATITDASELDAEITDATITDAYSKKYETIVSMTSKTAGVTEYIKVEIDTNGVLTISKSKKPEGDK